MYRNLTEAEAVAAVQLLKPEIFDWLVMYEDFINNNAHTHKYILNHMAANYLSLFGQFYILYKIHIRDSGRMALGLLALFVLM